MGSGEKIQLPALWTLFPSLPPILPPSPQFPFPPSHFPPLFAPCSQNSWEQREANRALGALDPFIPSPLRLAQCPPPAAQSTVGIRCMDAALLPPGVQSRLQRQEWGADLPLRMMRRNDPAGNQVVVGCEMGVGLRIKTGEIICKTYPDLQN